MSSNRGILLAFLVGLGADSGIADELLDAYRDEILRGAADKILKAAYDNDGDTWLWQDSGEIPARCAELIDPDKEESHGSKSAQ